jgi:hypothetical protein
MPTISVQQIQLRRGMLADLPGAPISFSPTVLASGLDEGELGYALDLGRLFIGVGGTPIGMANYNRSASPYANIEVLTENSSLTTIIGKITADNQSVYIQSSPLLQTTDFLNLRTLTNDVIQDYLVDVLSVNNVRSSNARVYYFVFDGNNNPIRQGILSIIWDVKIAAPICVDKAQTLISSAMAMQFRAGIIQAGVNQHVVIQYANLTGGTPTVLFRIDRPSAGRINGEFSTDFSTDFSRAPIPTQAPTHYGSDFTTDFTEDFSI